MFCDGRAEDHSGCVQSRLQVLTRLKVRVHERLVQATTLDQSPLADQFRERKHLNEADLTHSDSLCEANAAID